MDLNVPNVGVVGVILYVVEAGKPYWTAEVPYASNSIPASNILQITPYVSPRNPNGWPPENCNCKIKE